MTKEQLQLLLDYIDSLIDQRIEEAFGRDSWSESLKRSEIKDDLLRAFK